MATLTAQIKGSKPTSKPEKDKKEYETWSYSFTEGKVEVTLRVKEAENGFVIEVSRYTKGPEWKDECKTYISKTNPLEGKVTSSKKTEKEITAKQSITDSMTSLLQSIEGNNGDIIVD